jgi:phosphatidylglycerophosphate synthase
MALDKPLRHVKERVLSAFAQQVGTQFHPITITFAGFVVGLACAFCAANGGYLYALALWLINRFLDGLDGTVARETNRQSDFGGYLDILADFTIYALIPLALALSQQSEQVYIALGLLLTSFYINAASWMVLSSLLERRNSGSKLKGEYTSITMPAGLIEGTETITFYALFFLLPTQLTLLYLAMAVLVGITIIQRMWWAAKTL